MSFRGQDYAFDSPATAVAGMIASLASPAAARPPEAVGLDAARGRILAEAVLCDRDSPAFDYSAMDGYAVHAAEVATALHAAPPGASVTLRVVGESRIGSEPPVLPTAHAPDTNSAVAIRIVTGAAIPGGTGGDAVVRREDVTEHTHGTPADPGRVASITMTPHAAAKVREGDNIRRRGENARAGDVVLEAGSMLSAAALGTLAAVGRERPLVHPRVLVAVITTGDELVPPEVVPGPYQIRDSNAAVIRAVLGSQAWIEVVTLPEYPTMHAGDDRGALDAVLRAAIERADAVVLSGGVSMGHRDPVRAAVERGGGAGARIVFHGLPQRPGKPMLGAVLAGEGRATATQPLPPLPIFGLPGNPISAMVTCTRIVLPVLAAAAGASVVRAPGIGTPRLVPLANPDGKRLDVWWHRLVRINGAGEAELIDMRGSGDIIAGGRSDGFVELPPATPSPGPSSAHASSSLVPFYPWPM